MAIDIIAAFEQQPPELDFVLPGFLSGTVGTLFSPGATGKSFWALQAAMAVAGGGEADILDLELQATGHVCYFAAEDPEPVLIRRLHSIGQHLSQAAREAVAEKLLLEPVVGKRLNVMDDKHLDLLVTYCVGARLVVFDTLSRIHQEDENDNGAMSALLQRLEWLAKETGAAVLFLHHASKAAAISGNGGEQQAARGASALVDNARWGAALTRMTVDEAKKLSDRMDRKPISMDRRQFFVKWSVPKNNYGSPVADRWFQRVEGGVLVPVELVRAKKESSDRRW